jgi:hypothetical protein
MTEDKRLAEYGRCKVCNEINTKYDWCLTCNAAHFRDDFDKWTSGNKEIDYFIQNTQINAWRDWLVLEWYPWSNFSEVEEIGKGGYGTVFRAKREIGRIQKWDYINNQWSREAIVKNYNEYFALKTIGHCELLSKDFLNEVTNLHLLYLIINTHDI